MDRRQLLKGGLLAGAALALGPAGWARAVAAPAHPGAGPYGPLGLPDANGIMLPRGFRSRLIALAGVPVAPSGYVWHTFPDGGACYATADGGWIYTSNSEVPAPGLGGAGAVRFRPNGAVAAAYPILTGTMTNCAGGPTPWGTWLSCEEHAKGRVWECDPRGRRAAVVRPAMGVFKHEAVAVDPVHRHLYLSEDEGDGRFYRFTPAAYPDLSAGGLEVAQVGAGGAVTWLAVPDPAAASTPTRRQVPASTPFTGGEGLWFVDGTVYLTTKGDNRVWAYDTATSTIEVLWNAASFSNPPLTGVDNITVAGSGDIYVAEDGGNMEVVMITPEGDVAPFLRVIAQEVASEVRSELAGPAFSPRGDRLYFSSQRAFVRGATYEVRGPFR